MELFYRRSGSGHPLIILHGLFGSGMNWSSLAKHFGKHYEVFLIDQRNHGRSPHDDVFNYAVMAEDIFEFFEKHGIEKASIIGHSMGAKTAFTFALNHPLMVDKLIAADMGIKEYPVQDEAIQKALLSLDFDEVGSRAQAETVIEPYISDWKTRAFILQNLHWGKDKRLGWRMNVPAILSNIDGVGRAIQVKEPYLGDTLFVKGALSDYILASDYPSILESFPSASFFEISDAGHWIHADNPEQFGEVVLEFLLGDESPST